MSRIATEIRTFCKVRGVRCPAKKLMVAEFLQKRKEYICAGNLYLALRNSNVKISYAAIYESLTWLTINGFVECLAGKGSIGNENRFRVKPK
ncbi:hypothetical protein DSL64_06305 [Dyadobacter luteus]|jgi:Fe2+ or Zn2+ uptake regulation protein|uniref:Transcriptional repressor n=1 Tax=Dyadobacter luteus TaxID=2259619 RepID=A0A3D8YF45_9BACT|nr:transcriptional repressor [Dyadobacter luteus]REA63223.1 hypothetical protein DSL64_06305 [Dyadobacter luteus]